MELFVEKIERELDRLKHSKSWLADKAGVSRQLINYWLKSKSLAGAEPIARVLLLEPKDLIK